MYLEDIDVKSKLKGICVFESKITQSFYTIFFCLSLLFQDPEHTISFVWLAP